MKSTQRSAHLREMKSMRRNSREQHWRWMDAMASDAQEAFYNWWQPDRPQMPHHWPPFSGPARLVGNCYVIIYYEIIHKIIIIIISGLHHYECVAPLVANASRVVGSGPGRLHLSITARGNRGHSAPSSSRSYAVVPVVSSNTQKARKSRSA